jgi:hypothetical protein
MRELVVFDTGIMGSGNGNISTGGHKMSLASSTTCAWSTWLASVSVHRSKASSSPTMGSSGSACKRMELMTARVHCENGGRVRFRALLGPGLACTTTTCNANAINASKVTWYCIAQLSLALTLAHPLSSRGELSPSSTPIDSSLH